MMKIAILLALVAAAFAEPIVPRLNPLSPTGRIVGGVAASIDEVPYQVSLQVFGIHICGGSIISNFYVLTAAHCMLYFPSWYNVRSGSALSGSGGTVSDLAFALIHDNYAVNSWGVPLNDISILRLRAPLAISSTQAPIPLYASGQESVVGSPGIITGWGALSEGGNAPSVLQVVTVPIVSKAECDAAYTAWGGLPAGQICAAAPEGDRDACSGDSGGPLAIDGVLAGVVSWGNGCARAGYPGVYAEIAAYREWINIMTGV